MGKVRRKAVKKNVAQHADASKWQDKIVGHELVALDKLLPHPKNWRRHPRKQNVLLQGAIEDVGYIKSITVSKRSGRILDGHLRLELARQLGVEKIRVEYVDLTEEEEAKALLTLDPIAMLATPNDDLLASLGTDVDLNAILSGDLRDFIAGMTGQAEKGATDEEWTPGIDEGKALAKKYDVKMGQIWQLGEHLVMCGDSTKDLDAVLDGRKVDLVVTSPPYNLDVAYKTHDDVKKAWEEYSKFLKNVLRPAVEALGSGRALVWNIGVNKSTFHLRQGALLEQDFNLELVRQVIWKKVGVPLPKSQPFDKVRGFNPLRVHEVCYVFSKGKLAQGSRIETNHPLYEYDVFELHQSKATEDLPEGEERTGAGKSSSLTKRSKKAHPAAYPVALPEMFIQHLTEAGELVLDPFGGSGTTMMACEKLGRKCVSMELSPDYVAVMIERWATITGGTPVLMNGKKGGKRK